MLLFLVLMHFDFMIKELQELHSALEEAKADIVGLWALKFLINQVCHSLGILAISCLFCYIHIVDRHAADQQRPIIPCG